MGRSFWMRNIPTEHESRWNRVDTSRPGRSLAVCMAQCTAHAFFVTRGEAEAAFVATKSGLEEALRRDDDRRFRDFVEQYC